MTLNRFLLILCPRMFRSQTFRPPMGSKLSRTLLAILMVTLCLPLCSAPLLAQDSDKPKDETPGVNSGLVSALKFRGIGPAFMSGRIGDIVVDPVQPSTWYVAACSGGVWKTTNAGVTFKPIFDGQGSYSIGCLALDPNDRFTLWVGTCLLYTSPSPRDLSTSRMPSSA